MRDNNENKKAIWKKEGLGWALYVDEKGPFATVFDSGSWFICDEEGKIFDHSIEDSIESAKKIAFASAIENLNCFNK